MAHNLKKTETQKDILMTVNLRLDHHPCARGKKILGHPLKEPRCRDKYLLEKVDAWLHVFLVLAATSFFLGSTHGGRESPTRNFHSCAFFFEPMQTSLQSLVLDTFVNMGRSCDGTRLHYTVRSAGGHALVTPEAGVLLAGWNKTVSWGLKLTSFLCFQSCQHIYSSMNLV